MYLQFYKELYDGEEKIIDICKGKERFKFKDNIVSINTSMMKHFSFPDL